MSNKEEKAKECVKKVFEEQYVTGGCSIANQSFTVSITQEKIDELRERRKKELMALSKEYLVELIIGRKHV